MLITKLPSGKTKVTITETTTPEELETAFPMLKVKSDTTGQYIRVPYCRFTPGTYFMLGHDGIPKEFYSIPRSKSINLNLNVSIDYDIPETEVEALFTTLNMDIVLFKPVINIQSLLELIRKHATEQGPFTEKDYNQLRTANANPQTN